MQTTETKKFENDFERVQHVLRQLDSNGFGPAENYQKLLDEAGLPIKLWAGWKVTKKFIAEVVRNGGTCTMAIGTPLVTDASLLNDLMKHFKVVNPESFGGHGTQFYSDKACLLEALKGPAEYVSAGGL